jgi:hypothetical protein
MPVQNMFQSLRERIMKSPAFKPMEKRALYWFKTFQTDLMRWQRSLGTITYGELQEQKISKSVVTPSKLTPGSLYFFMYEPVGAKAMPYYDRFPFVLVIDKDEKGFRGLNFHYLDYYWRAWLFDNLYEQRRQNPDPLKVTMSFSYDYLANTSKYKQFRPCFKRYLFKQLRSPLLQVGESEWDVALWLPVELYTKAPATDVWKDSQRKFS